MSTSSIVQKLDLARELWHDQMQAGRTYKLCLLLNCPDEDQVGCVHVSVMKYSSFTALPERKSTHQVDTLPQQKLMLTHSTDHSLLAPCMQQE